MVAAALSLSLASRPALAARPAVAKRSAVAARPAARGPAPVAALGANEIASVAGIASEIASVAGVMFAITLVGLSVGFVLLRVEAYAEENEA